MPQTVSASDVEAAFAKISPSIRKTPFLPSKTLSDVTGAEVFVKFENLQFTASFKERGALNRLISLTPSEKNAGVVAMSAGNHALGVAYHAMRLGISAVIVMPENTPFIKISHTENFGAKVIIKGRTLEESYRAALEEAEKGRVFVHPYNDASVIAGQGTTALEMLSEIPNLDCLVVPVGGGGLFAGMLAYVSEKFPGIEMIGVEMERYASLQAALRNETAQCGGDTIAEGIAVKSAGEIPCDVIKKHPCRILTLKEESVEEAVALYLNVEKTVAEGAGAASLAVLLQYPDDFRGKKTGLVLSGGNIDSRILATVLLRSLVREGRMVRLRFEIQDSPGVLAAISSIIGSCGGNIIEVSHQRIFAHVSVKNAWLDMALETRDSHHVRDIVSKLKEAGFSPLLLDDQG